MADRRGAVEARLRDVPFFSALPAAPLRTIAARLKRLRFKPGDTVFREGDPADTLFLVETGRVHVWTSDDRQLLASLGPGSILGEIALLLDVPRTATVRAVTACSMLALTRRSLNELVRRYPSISAELTRELGRRLRSTSRHVERGRAQQTVAIWGPGAGRLANAVRAASKNTPAIVSIPGAPVEERTSTRAARWIDASDVDFNALVLHGLRVDDHELLFIALSSKPCKQNELALDVADQIVVFDDVPGWLRERSAGRPLIPASTAPDLERAVRWVTGRSVGLVLSSGGSRSVAHIGVVAVLRERGIPIDIVSGSSGGALFAAGVAAGFETNEMIEYTRQFAKITKLRRLDVNLRTRGSLLKGKEMHRTFQRILDGRQFTDLEIPLIVVATDLHTGEEVFIDKGSVADAVRASMSIPGIIEPLELDGRLLTDGAVVDPLPASVLRAAGAHHLIASNVAGLGSGAAEHDGIASLGFLGMVNRVNALREQQIISRQTSLVDGVIRPRVYAASALDFRQIEQFVEAGAAAARLQLPEFEKRLTSAARPGR
jgi:NTE family protein